MPSQLRVTIVDSDLCFAETRCSSRRPAFLKQTLTQTVLAATGDCLPVCLAWTVFQTSQTVLGSHAHCQGQERLGEGSPALAGVLHHSPAKPLLPAAFQGLPDRFSYPTLIRSGDSSSQ